MSFQIRAVVAATLLAVGHSMAVAQTAPARPAAGAASATLPSTAAALGSDAKSADPSYRSAFEGYRRFVDQPVGSWREANDLVGRIGGWQAYAREGQAAEQPVGSVSQTPAMPPAASTPGPLPSPVRAPVAGAETPAGPASGMHSGHKKP